MGVGDIQIGKGRIDEGNVQVHEQKAAAEVGNFKNNKTHGAFTPRDNKARNKQRKKVCIDARARWQGEEEKSKNKMNKNCVQNSPDRAVERSNAKKTPFGSHPAPELAKD